MTEGNGAKGCGQMFILILAIPVGIGAFATGAFWWMF